MHPDAIRLEGRALLGGIKVKKASLMVCSMVAACLGCTMAVSTAARDKASDANRAMASPQSPSTAAQPYLVMSRQSVEDAVKELQADNKIKNLVSGAGIGCRVFIQHEKDTTTSQAEVHDGADDIFIILEGSATLTLGGALDSPKQVQPGEWRAAAITGGREFTLVKGDVVVVPRGTPHRRTTPSQDVTLMVIKASTPASR